MIYSLLPYTERKEGKKGGGGGGGGGGGLTHRQNARLLLFRRLSNLKTFVKVMHG